MKITFDTCTKCGKDFKPTLTHIKYKKHQCSDCLKAYLKVYRGRPSSKKAQPAPTKKEVRVTKAEQSRRLEAALDKYVRAPKQGAGA